ncbi:hypothetical protein [Azovibrio restrictus]|uniref:hypothetical protein n=1 Tax=Azovibrio restrictus TaxID=146938 RepID=UPI0026EAE396|nr:hypothetical protein [Azovibrio restrictus]
MRNLLSILAALLLSANAWADVLTAYDTPKGSVQPLSKDATVWVKCFGCEVLKERIVQRLKDAGYSVVGKTAEAATRVVIAAGVSVPQDGKAPRLYADDAYGKGLAPIPPAIKRDDLAEANTPTVGKGVLHLDAGAQYQGAKLTGSQTGGILVGLGTALLTRLIHQSAADAARTPGVAELSVTIVTERDGRLGFGVTAAANTPETPDTLLDSAIDAAIVGLINGVQDVKAAKNAFGDGNAQQ